MQVEIGSDDRQPGTSRHDDVDDFGCVSSEIFPAPHNAQQRSVGSSIERPLPARSAARDALAAYCSSLLRTYVDVKLSEPPGAGRNEIHTLTARLAAALPAALAAADSGAALRYSRAAPASSSALGISCSAAAAASCLLSRAVRTVTHAAALTGTFQLVFEVVEGALPAAPAPVTAADTVAVAALGAALPAVLLGAAAEQQQQQQQMEAVEIALQQALAVALLPGWGIKSVQLDPQVQAQQQQQQQSAQDQAVAALAAAAQGLALRPAAVALCKAADEAAGTAGSSRRASRTEDEDGEASVAVELLLPARSVQQLVAAGQESLRAVVLSCTPGRLLGRLLLDTAWKLQADGDADHAAAATGRTDAIAGPDASTLGAEVGCGKWDAVSLQMQLRLNQGKPPLPQQQQQQQSPAGITEGPAAAVAAVRTNAIKGDAGVGGDANPASRLSECQVLCVVLMTAPAAAEAAADPPQHGFKQAATATAAAASVAESSEPGEGDSMLAQLPLLVLPAGAQAELQGLVGAAAAAGVPYVAMYRQLLPLLQDWELLLTLCVAPSGNSSSSSSDDAGGGNGSDGQARRGDRAAAGPDGRPAAASGIITVDGGGSKDGEDARGGMGGEGSGGSAHGKRRGDGSRDSGSTGDSSGWASGDCGSAGSSIDADQLRAAAAALGAYFEAHGMPECLKLVQAIEQQLQL